MASVSKPAGVNYRFGNFEFRAHVPELCKYGSRLKLERKPLAVLAALLERAGEVVSREELQQCLWDKNTFVDFELGLNVAVRKLRAVFGDSADAPRYIETLSGRGYRFICPVLLAVEERQVTVSAPVVDHDRSRLLPVIVSLATVFLLAIFLLLRHGISVRSVTYTSSAAGERTATTDSPRALALFNSALDALDDDDARSAELLESALKIDSNFASAHVYLAWCYYNLGNRAAAAPHFERAMQLASKASEVERLFIIGSYYHVAHPDPQRARDAYSELLQLDPSHSWAINNLAGALQNAGVPVEAWPMKVKLSDLRPANFRFAVAALLAIEQVSGDEREAARLLLRSQQLATEDAVRKNPLVWMQLQLLEIGQSEHRGDFGAAVSAADKMLLALPQFSGEDHDQIAYRLTIALMELGRLHQAQVSARGIADEELRAYLLTLAAATMGDQRPLAAYLRRRFETAKGVGPGILWRLPDVGLLSEAQVVVRDPTHYGMSAVDFDILRGKLALAQGDTTAAVRYLRPWFEHALQHSENNDLSVIALPLARALERTGDRGTAVAALESAFSAKQFPFSDGSAGPLLRNDVILELIRLHQARANYRRAQELRGELQSLLTVADQDHPLRRRLQAELRKHADVSAQPQAAAPHGS